MIQGKFKLRFYHLSGPEKGNLEREEYFANEQEAIRRFREVFKPGLLTLNPTMWIRLREGEDFWRRLTLTEIAEVAEGLDSKGEALPLLFPN